MAFKVWTMDDYQKLLMSTNKYVNVELSNIPEQMQDAKLYEFCSLFGIVNTITRSNIDKSHATVQYIDVSFNDPAPIQNAPTLPYIVSDMPDEVNRLRTTDPRRNGQFLSDLLKTLNEDTEYQAPKDENQNVVKSSDSDCSYLECTYCYSLADFLCERCRSPYCSPKCQRTDWLKHKKFCSKVKKR